MKKFLSLPLLLLLLTTTMALKAAEKDATLDWSQRWTLSTPISGAVQTVTVNEGDSVKKGQLLLTLDDRGYRAQVKRANSTVSRAKENYDEAKRELDRGQELFDRTAISVHELQVVKIDYATALAHVNDAEAGLVLAKLDLEYAQLKAPDAGTVIQVNTHPHQIISNRLEVQPLIVMVSNDQWVARAQLSADEINEWQSGQVVQVQVGSETYQGKVKRIGFEPSTATSKPMYELEVEFSAAGKTFRKGQSAKISS